MLKKLLTKNVFCKIMMLVIMLQSTASFADAHEAHQSGNEHLSFEHQHDAHADSDDSHHNDLQNETLNFDCHHCCHCHGHHMLWIVDDFAVITSSTYHNVTILYRVEFSSLHKERLLRPPRS